MQDFPEALYKKKREDYSINIRKNLREQKFLKRRNLKESCQMTEEMNEQKIGVGDRYEIIEQNNIQKLKGIYEEANRKMLNNQLNFPKLKNTILYIITNEPDNSLVLYQTIIEMNLLSKEKEGSEQILHQLMPNLVMILLAGQYPQLQYEILTIICNITYHCCFEEYYPAFKQNNLIQSILKLLHSDIKQIREESIGIIGNIACENKEMRQHLIQADALTLLIDLINHGKQIQNCAWALSVISKGQNLETTKQALSAIIRLVSNNTIREVETLRDCLTLIAEKCNGSALLIEFMISSGMYRRITELLRHKSLQILLPSLEICNKLTDGSSNQVSRLVKEPGFLDSISYLLKNTKKGIRSEVFAVLQNLLVGEKQLKLILDHAPLMEILSYLFKEQNLDLKKEIYMLFGTFAELTNSDDLSEQVYKHLININIADDMIESLKSGHSNLIKTVLKNMMPILEMAENIDNLPEEENFLFLMESKGLYQLIEVLESHQDEEITEIVEEFIFKYKQI